MNSKGMLIDRQVIRRTLACTAAALLVSACGGGGGSTVSVTNLVASGLAYGRTLTVSANGSGLSNGELTMTIDSGSCTGLARTAGSNDAQAQFTCRIDSIGRITAVLRLGASAELARVSADVPTPLVSFSVTDGTRTGTVVVELDPIAAPLTSRNFIDYVITGFYNQTIIHRVLPGRIVQGGGYTADRIIKAPLFAPIPLESLNGLKNLRGTIAMARSDLPDSATSQFYFNAIDNPAFDADGAGSGYAVFGRVTTGLDVIDVMSRVPLLTLSNEFSSIPATQITVTAVVQLR